MIRSLKLKQMIIRNLKLKQEMSENSLKYFTKNSNYVILSLYYNLIYKC